MKRSKQQKLLRQWIAPSQPRQVSSGLRRLLLHYINFYPPETESLSDVSGTVTAVMVLLELLDEGEPEARGEE